MQLRLLSLLMMIVVLSPIAIDIYLPSMPVMATEFGVSSSEIQSTLALFLFAMGLGQIIIGPLADKYGRRPVVLAGISLYIISSLIAVFSYNFSYLQFSRVLQGLAACAASIVVFSAVRDRFSPKDCAKVYSYLNGAICVIPALAPTFGGILALQFGWRSNFLFMALYGLAVLCVISFTFKETRPETTVSEGALYRWARYKPVISNSHFMFYAFTCMSGMAAILCYVSYSPVWLIERLGLSTLSFSALFGLNAAINIAACFTAPLVIKALGNRTTVIVAQLLLLISAVALLALYYYGSHSGLIGALSFMLPMMFLCIGFALLLGPATSMALAGFGDRAGTATAVLGFIQMSGASVITALVQQTELDAPLAVAMVLGILSSGFLVVMMLNRFAKWHREPTNAFI